MTAAKYEKAFLVVSAGLLVLFLGALAYAVVGRGIHVPSRAGEIDPGKVYQTPPFDQPGVQRVGPNHYEVVLVAQYPVFVPRQFEVPAGARVTFRATSADVIHGLHVKGTRVNLMLVPGQITEATYTFDEVGKHAFYCHEYCGPEHHLMSGSLRVTE